MSVIIGMDPHKRSATIEVAKAADIWMQRVEQMVRDERRSPGTRETYRRQLNAHVLPALGQLRLVEITTPLLDRFISRLAVKVGPATARTSRTITSGVLGMAVRQGAIVANPVRELERVEGKRRRDPRALTEDERSEWFVKLPADQRAVDFDLIDFSLFLLATGLRIGEALAVLWEEVDLETGSINVTSTMIRVTGEGLLRTAPRACQVSVGCSCRPGRWRCCGSGGCAGQGWTCQ